MSRTVRSMAMPDRAQATALTPDMTIDGIRIPGALGMAIIEVA